MKNKNKILLAFYATMLVCGNVYLGAIDLSEKNVVNQKTRDSNELVDRILCSQEDVFCPSELLQEEAFRTNVTAYTGVESCSNTGCLMANGDKAFVGAAACPRRLNLGTKIVVEGLGEFVCADRTAKWVDGRVDLFFGYTQKDYQRALQFGKQNLVVTIKSNE